MQGVEQLRDRNNGFCCLGVLCNLHAQAHPEIAETQTDPREYLGETQFLPKAVLKWSGVDQREATVPLGILIQGVYYNSLVDANDNFVGFGEIADWIEQNYHLL